MALVSVCRVAHESDPRFLVIHALKVKGFAKVEVLGDMTGLAAPDLEAQLSALAAAELAMFREGRLSAWALTPAGKQAHLDALLADLEASGALDALREPYPEFLDLNERFKGLCGAWQLRDGEPNDHADPDYDRQVIDGLLDLHGSATSVVDRFANVMARYGVYPPRLDGAAQRVQEGQHKMFTGVMCNSYHDVWMELHEDLIATLGIDRAAEGSF